MMRKIKLKLKPLYTWEKRDVVEYITKNFKGVEFTTEELIKKFMKWEHDHYWFGDDDKIISNHLNNLLNEGFLTVRHISVKMEPDQYYWDRRKTRFGSKTITIFKINTTTQQKTS